MKNRFYSSIIIGVMAAAMSGCSVIDKASSVKYDVIDIKKITDAEFDLTSYAKNELNSEIYVKTNSPTIIGDNYLKVTISYFNEKERNIGVLVFDHELSLVANIVFDRDLYDIEKFEIESSIKEKKGVLYYPDNAKKFIPHKQIVGVPMPLSKSNGKTKIMLSVNGGEYKEVNRSDLFDVSKLTYSELDGSHDFYAENNYDSVFDPETRYLSSNIFFDLGGGCKEDDDFKRLICPKNRYELKIDGEVIFISKKKVDFNYNYFASDLSRSTIMKGPVVLGSYRSWRARIIPITKDGDVNLVLTGNNNFAKYTASSGGININGGAIVFNKKIAGPSVHTSISSFFSKVDECKYSFLATENNTQKEKIFVVNVCRFKSI